MTLAMFKKTAMNIIAALPLLSLSSLVIAEQVMADQKIADNQSAQLSDKKARDANFPWERVIDRGKINGCIYNNKFYSNGAVLIEDTLSRKCRIDPNRDGYWAELNERELQLFEASVKAQQKLEATSLNIGDVPINKYEAAMVRLMRKNVER